MTDEVARVGVGIVGDDRTAEAWQSAEKRAKQSQKRVGEINRKSASDAERGQKRVGQITRKAVNDNERLVSRSSKSIIGTMRKVEQATSGALGNKSPLGALAGRLGMAGTAASALGDGLAGASVAGSGLATAAGAVGVAVGSTVAVLGAAAYAALQLKDGWAQGAAQLDRLAERAGVSTKALTAFDAAAERAGMAKGSGAATMSSLSDTLNDARYGRNSQALEVLRRLNIRMKTKADGTVDTEQMLPAIADAMKRQNASGRRTVARLLGIPDDAIQVFSQGGKSLGAEMRDAQRRAPVIDEKAGETARVAERNRVIKEQLKSASLSEGGRRVAEMTNGTFDKTAIAVYGAFNDVVHGDFKSASRKIGDAGTELGRAAERLSQSAGTTAEATAGALSGAFAMSGRPGRQKDAAQIRDFFVNKGWSKAAASGIAANLFAESTLNPGAIGDGGKARGIGQWHPDRQANFKKLFGHDIRRSTMREQLEFVHWELQNTEKAAGDALRRATSAREAGAIVSRRYERPKAADYEAAKRGQIASSIESAPSAPAESAKVDVHVTVEQGKVTKVKTKAGAGPKAAISHALVN